MADAGTHVVRGIITVPANAPPVPVTLLVRVEDVSRADAPSTVVAEQRRANLRLTPGEEVPFAVEVPADRIDPQHHYTVSVHVDASGTGAVKVGDLITTQSHPVLTWGYGSEARPTLRKV